MRSKVSKDFTVTLSSSALIMLLGALSGILIARLLGPEGRGEVTVLLFWPQLLATVGLLSLNDVVVHRLALKQGDAQTVVGDATVVGAVLLLATISIGICGLSLLYAQHPVRAIQLAELFLVSYTPAYFGMAILSAVDQGVLSFKSWNLFRLAAPLALVVLLLFLWAGKLASSDTVLWTISVSVWTAFTLRLLFRRSPITIAWAPARWVALLREAARFHLPVAVTMILTQAERFVVIAFLPVREVGIYAVAWSYAVGIPVAIMFSAHSVLLPRLSGVSARAERRRFALQSLRYGSLLSILVAIVLATPALWVVPLLYGDAFRESASLSLILIASGILSGIRQMVTRAMKTDAFPQIALLTEIVAAAGFASSVTILAPSLGLFEIAYSGLVGAGLAFLCLVVLLWRIEGISPKDWIAFNEVSLRDVFGFLRR